MTTKRTRKFNGKTYRLHDWYLGLTSAKMARDSLKAKEYAVRLTTRKLGPTSVRGVHETPAYYVWFRKGEQKPPKPKRRIR